MARNIFRRDSAGIAEFLKSKAMHDMVNKAAERIAADVRSQLGTNIPVLVDHYETDRAAAAVTIAHPSGLPMQARHGTLTRAAGSIGVEVTTYPEST